MISMQKLLLRFLHYALYSALPGCLGLGHYCNIFSLGYRVNMLSRMKPLFFHFVTFQGYYATCSPQKLPQPRVPLFAGSSDLNFRLTNPAGNGISFVCFFSFSRNQRERCCVKLCPDGFLPWCNCSPYKDAGQVATTQVEEKLQKYWDSAYSRTT